MSLVAELLDFLRTRKKFWLFPIVLTMLLVGILLLVAEVSVVAPFIYTLW
jgi:hypothetical protein